MARGRNLEANLVAVISKSNSSISVCRTVLHSGRYVTHHCRNHLSRPLFTKEATWGSDVVHEPMLGWMADVAEAHPVGE